jgi:CheY-like chemotaxis protein
MKALILVVDDEPDVEILFRQQFRRDVRADRFMMEFAQSANVALQCIVDAKSVSLILILSDINMPEMTGLAQHGVDPFEMQILLINPAANRQYLR